MTLTDILNSNLTDSQKIEVIKMLQSGGHLTDDQKAGRAPIKEDGEEYYLSGDGTKTPADHYKRHPEERGAQKGNQKILHPTETIEVGDKEIDIEIARTREEKRDGLSRISKIVDGEGMLFIFDEPSREYFTMKDTSVDLDIIFISEDLEVLEVHTVRAHDARPVTCEAEYQYVLETAPNSGIQVGDEVDAEGDLTEEDKQQVNNRMLVLDSDGDVQMTLQGGERIFSRISTKKIIRAALKAYHSDNDADYAKVAKIVFKELDAQDSREPQYTSLPDE